MAESARVPSGTDGDRKCALPSRAMLRLVAKGMSIRDIVKLFPEFSVDQVRAALLRVADLAEDDSAFLPAEDPVWDLLEAARSRAGLEENEAMALALEATNETRK